MRFGHNRLVGGVVAAASMLLLAGCGALPLGAASVVGGTEISRQEVTDLADAQCAGVAVTAQQGGGGQAVPRKLLTQRALGLLIDIQLNLEYGRSLGLEPRPAEVSRVFAQVDPLIKALPAKYRSATTEVFQRFAEGRDIMVQVGERKTGQQLSQDTEQAILNAGYAERDAWAKGKDLIDTDPRYGPSKAGWPGEADASVSRARSSFAKSSDAQTPSASFVAGLPAGQRCG